MGFIKTEMIVKRNQFVEDKADVYRFEIKSNKGPWWQEQWNEQNIWEREASNHHHKGRCVEKQEREGRCVALAIYQHGSNKSQVEQEKLKEQIRNK